jgi:hypothetical protein
MIINVSSSARRRNMHSARRRLIENYLKNDHDYGISIVRSGLLKFLRMNADAKFNCRFLGQ